MDIVYHTVRQALNPSPYVIIMNLMMTKMDGVAATADNIALRKQLVKL